MTSRFVSAVVTNAILIYLLTHGYGIVAMAATTLVVGQLASLTYYAIAKHLFRPLVVSRVHYKRALVPQLFTYSVWSLVAQIANTFRFGVDAFVIGWLQSASSVTYYTVAMRIVEYFADLIYKATNVMVPVFTVEFFKGDMAELRRKYLLVVRLTAVPSLFGAGMIIILGKNFILRWMGSAFEQSYPLSVVLVIAMALETMGNPSDSVLYAVSKHRYLAWINCAEAVANFCLSVVLIGPFGLLGVAIGTAIPLIGFRLIVVPRIVARAIDLPISVYYRSLVPVTVLSVSSLVATAALLSRYDAEPSYLYICAVSAVVSPLYLCAVAFVVFSRQERVYMFSLVPSSLQRLWK